MSTVNGQQMLNTVNAIYKSNATQSLSHLLLALKAMTSFGWNIHNYIYN